MPWDALELYRQYHAARSDERFELFGLLAARFGPRSALYPGCFVHLTPALCVPRTSFVDTDRRAARFFADPAVLDYVRRHRVYDDEPILRFHAADYTADFDESPASFDLLISQYAGFVSQHCKQYLKLGGYLIANNSHGDASLASVDPDYQPVAVVNRRGEQFRLVEVDVASYFVPARDVSITRAELERRGRGIAYQKRAFGYVFRRVA